MSETFSKNLRKLRHEKNLTQEQVADRLCVSAQSVSRWETGVTYPDVILLPEIAKLYNVLVDDLFKEGLQAYGKLSNRLLAVYGDTCRNEDFMAAAAEFERMLKEDTMTADDYRSYGWLHMKMLLICKKKTLEYYDKAMELSKNNDTEFYYNMKIAKLGFRADILGEAQQCIDEQLQAVKNEPDNAGEWVCLVVAYYWAKQYEECYRLVKDAIAKFPEEPYLYNLAGDVCEELKKYDEAFAYWEKHLEFKTHILESLFSIAFCHEELGEYDKAYEAWMRLVEIFNAQGADVDVKFPLRKAAECKEKMEE